MVSSQHQANDQRIVTFEIKGQLRWSDLVDVAPQLAAAMLDDEPGLRYIPDPDRELEQEEAAMIVGCSYRSMTLHVLPPE